MITVNKGKIYFTGNAIKKEVYYNINEGVFYVDNKKSKTIPRGIVGASKEKADYSMNMKTRGIYIFFNSSSCANNWISASFKDELKTLDSLLSIIEYYPPIETFNNYIINLLFSYVLSKEWILSDVSTAIAYLKKQNMEYDWYGLRNAINSFAHQRRKETLDKELNVILKRYRLEHLMEDISSALVKTGKFEKFIKNPQIFHYWNEMYACESSQELGFDLSKYTRYDTSVMCTPTICALANRIIEPCEYMNIPIPHTTLSSALTQIMETLRVYNTNHWKERLALTYKPSLQYENEDFIVIVPKTQEEYKEEAQNQNNCVYRLYMEQVAEGNTHVVFIRRKNSPNKSYITCEVDNANRIQQYLKSCNEQVSNENAIRFKEEYQKYLLTL